jgi:hypothetical protein
MVERQLPKLDTRVRFPSPAKSLTLERFTLLTSNEKKLSGPPPFCRWSFALFPLFVLFLFGSPRVSVSLTWDPPRKTKIDHYRIYYADMQSEASF